MQKLMFDDKRNLTEMVIDYEKEMTRRIEKFCKSIPDAVKRGFTRFEILPNRIVRLWNDNRNTFIEYKTRFAIGEVVAIAQSYEDADTGWIKLIMNNRKMYDAKKHKIIQGLNDPIHPCAGLGNKMFVKADLMPHQIRIAGIKIERIQDISNEDCLKEGIFIIDSHEHLHYGYHNTKIGDIGFLKPRDAFSHLINAISGKGTWEENPYVVVYSFKLIK